MKKKILNCIVPYLFYEKKNPKMHKQTETVAFPWTNKYRPKR